MEKIAGNPQNVALSNRDSDIKTITQDKNLTFEQKKEKIGVAEQIFKIELDVAELFKKQEGYFGLTGADKKQAQKLLEQVEALKKQVA